MMALQIDLDSLTCAQVLDAEEGPRLITPSHDRLRGDGCSMELLPYMDWRLCYSASRSSQS